MQITVQSYFQRLRLLLRRWSLDPQVHKWLKTAGAAAAGFLLSAASLSHHLQPFALGLLCALTGLPSVVVSLGGAVGYLLFWGSAGVTGVLWCGIGLLFALSVGSGRIAGQSPWLMPALAGVITAAVGLWMQYRGLQTAPTMYILQIAVAVLSTRLFAYSLQKRDAVTDWLLLAVAALALCQVLPLPWLCLGYPFAAAVAVSNTFPAAALCGLALDLAEVTPVSMTAVLSAAWLVRLLPLQSSWKRSLAPVCTYALIMALTGSWDLAPLPGLAMGGMLALLLPGPTPNTQRRGETGIAQVRLEMTAEVYRQVEQLLMEQSPPKVDQQALIYRACEHACSNCSYRKSCTGKEQAQTLSPKILEQPITDSALPFSCRRTGRLLNELRRSQEQARLLRSLHRQQEEAKQALIQQYRFLSLHLQSLSDSLCRRAKDHDLRFEPEVVFGTNRAMGDNGDRCLHFSGTANRYYVALLDGMGTGIGAADEATQAGLLLKGLLCAGFPAEHALATLNSLCALRSRAGAVTADLLELELDSGRASLYKWGTPSSWLLRKTGCEKIGTAGPPPGLLVADNPEAAQRLSLRRGEILLLLSDGVSGEDALSAASAEAPLNEQVERILSSGVGEASDDATVALVRLCPRDLG